MGISFDQAAVVTTLIGNIVIQLSIQMQRYAKKELLSLALHGTSIQAQQRLLSYIKTLLVLAECFFFLTYGLERHDHFTPLGIFSAMCNTCLPILYNENDDHAVNGTLFSLFGMALAIVAHSGPEDGKIAGPRFDIYELKTQISVGIEVMITLLFVYLRAANTQQYEYKLFGNCGLSAIMGSVTTVLVQCLMHQGETTVYIHSSIIITMIVVLLILQCALAHHFTKLFPIWQVVPHYFVSFLVMVYYNKAFVFHQLDYMSRTRSFLLFCGYSFLKLGVWMAAKPHVELPYIDEREGVFSELERRTISNMLGVPVRIADVGGIYGEPVADRIFDVPRRVLVPEELRGIDIMRILRTPAGQARLAEEYEQWAREDAEQNSVAGTSSGQSDNSRSSRSSRSHRSGIMGP